MLPSIYTGYKKKFISADNSGTEEFFVLFIFRPWIILPSEGRERKGKKEKNMRERDEGKIEIYFSKLQLHPDAWLMARE